MLRYTLQNLLRHAWRTLATVFGIAIGIAAVLATVTVGDNINANLARVFGTAAGRAELILAPGAGERAVLEARRAEAVARATPGVVATLATLEYYAVLRDEAERYQRPVVPGVQGGFLLSGQDTSRPQDLPVRLASGRFPRAGSNGIAVSQAFASREGLSEGSRLRLVGPLGELSFTVTGTLAADAGLANLNAGQVGVVNLSDLQKATFLEGRVSYLGLILARGSDAERVRADLERHLPAEFSVLYPAGRGQVSNGLVQTVQSGLQVLAATLMALAGFLAYNTFAAAVVERQREFALLRTLGFTRAQVLRMGYLEAATVSALGIVVGIGLGAGLSAAITFVNALLLEFPFVTLTLPWDKLLLAAAVGTVTALVAASGPARAASRVAPVVAAREAYVAGTRTPYLLGLLLLIAGLAAALWRPPREYALPVASIAMALVFVGIALVAPALIPATGRVLGRPLRALLGLPGRLGIDFASRSRGRNGVAVGAVALGLGLIVGVGGMVSGINDSLRRWVDTTIVGDMFVAAAAPFPADFKARLSRTFPELSEVSAVSVRVARFRPPGGRARNASVILTDPERYDPRRGSGQLQFLPGQGSLEATSDAFYRGRGVYVSGTIADRYGTYRGSTLELRTSRGWLPFRVLGVVVDYTSAGESVIGNLGDLELFGGGRPELYVLSVRPGVEAQAVGARLKRVFPELFLDVQYNRPYKDLILNVTGQFFGTTHALLAVAVFVAALGVANTLGMNLAERMHEMAVLRALGLTRGGLTRAIIAEGVLVTVLGTVLGLLAGAALGQTITAAANSLTGYRVAPSYPPGLFLTALLASPLIGVLAALLPARRASRLQPARALRASEEA
nr:ABC transporter permease [Deinobacterium chartae]